MLESRRIPPSRLGGALLLAALFVYAYGKALAAKHQGLLAASPPLALLLTMLLPLTALLLITALLPLLVYVADHAPFNDLVMPRPDHYARLVVRVYTAWIGANDGKLKEKNI